MTIAQPNEPAKTGGIQVIARAGRILRALKDHPAGLSLGQIAHLSGLARSTVQRIIFALEEEAFVVPASASGGYRLGPGLVSLAQAIQFDLRDELRPFLQQLSARVDETVDLSILEHGHVYFLDQITAPQRLQAVSAIGASFPLHCTANGKAILSMLSWSDCQRLLPATLESFTPHTITAHADLKKELEAIRERGVAYDCEEHSVGVCAVGAAIHTPTGKLAAITIPLPAARFYEREEGLVAALQELCGKIHERFS
ncbi:IclR family transcriptional regulator [Brevibacillus fluminis]|uniref:IclR family transcriptional regulator n=1 Tax=Brevibacillus fluminis TaxID=511487 RepID=UPI003F8CD325